MQVTVHAFLAETTVQVSFVFHRSLDLRDLHSFPTRRSSDLERRPRRARGAAQAAARPALRRAAAHAVGAARESRGRSEEHTSELQSHSDLVCRLLLEKKHGSELSVIARRHLDLTGKSTKEEN